MNDILSLCEITPHDIDFFIKNNNHEIGYKVVYIGSEFCWDKLSTENNWEKIIQACHKRNISVFFVLPILSERYFSSFNILARNLVYNNIDGFVVNDYGTLLWIRQEFPNHQIVIGRLLVKSPRDYIDPIVNLSLNRVLGEIQCVYIDYHCAWVDVDYDYIKNVQPKTITIPMAVHSTSYLTSSMRCDYKYDPKIGYVSILGQCQRECFHSYICIPNTTLRKFGNTLVFLPQYGPEYDNYCHIKDLKIETLFEIDGNENNGPIKPVL